MMDPRSVASFDRNPSNHSTTQKRSPERPVAASGRPEYMPSYRMKSSPDSSMSPCPLIESLEMDLTSARLDVLSPLSDGSHAFSACSSMIDTPHRRKSSTESESNQQRTGSSKVHLDRWYSESYCREKETGVVETAAKSSSSPRRSVPRRESISVEELLLSAVKSDAGRKSGFRLSKSMTDLASKPYGSLNSDTSKERRSPPRREYMPVEVLALQTMDLEDEERTMLSGRLSKSMTDLLLSPKSKAFDNLTDTNKSRRKLAITKSDSSQHMPSLPIREESFKVSKNRNASFKLEQHSHEKNYIDQLIMKSALSVKSPWHLKQTLNLTDQLLSELQGKAAISKPRAKSNMFLNDTSASSIAKGSYSRHNEVPSATEKTSMARGNLSRSMTNLSTSRSALLGCRPLSELPRSHSSERMPMMPQRRGSVENKTDKLANSAPISFSKVRAGCNSSEKDYINQLIMKSASSAKSPWHLKQTLGLTDQQSSSELRASAAISKPRVRPNMFLSNSRATSIGKEYHSTSTKERTGLACGKLSRSMTELSSSSTSLLGTRPLSEMSRSHSSERMPMMPKRRGSFGKKNGKVEYSIWEPASSSKVRTRHNSSEQQYIDQLIMKSALSVKSPWHLKQTLDLTDRSSSDQQKSAAISRPRAKPNMFFENKCSSPYTMGNIYSSNTVSSVSATETSGLSCGNLSRSMTNLSRSPSSLLASTPLSKMSRSHSSERMPMMPKRRGSFSSKTCKLDISNRTSKGQASNQCTEKECIDQLIMNSAASPKSPWHLKQTLRAA